MIYLPYVNVHHYCKKIVYLKIPEAAVCFARKIAPGIIIHVNKKKKSAIQRAYSSSHNCLGENSTGSSTWYRDIRKYGIQACNFSVNFALAGLASHRIRNECTSRCNNSN